MRDDEVKASLKSLAGWTGDARAIRAAYPFADYGSAVAFVVQVAMIAQRLDHHPEIILAWGRVELTFSTHDAGGVTAKDIVAAKAVAAIPRVPG